MVDTNMNQNNQYLACKATNTRITTCRIDLLNENLNKVSSLEGEIISGSIALKNDGLLRRDGTITLISSKELNTDYFKISLRNYIQVFIIIEDSINENIKAEFNLGIYLLNSPEVKLSKSERTITLTICDLMNLYNGVFGGGLPVTLIYTADTPITTILYSLLNDTDKMNYSRKKIEPLTYTLGSKQTYKADGTYADILKAMQEFYLDTEIFFDENGYFCYQAIKDKTTDLAIESLNLNNDDRIISIGSYKKNFENIRNKVKVFGATVTESTDTSTYQYSYEMVNDTGTPFSVDKIGERRKTYTDEKLYTNEQCQSKAKYYLQKASNLAEKISFQLIPIYHLVPNRIIEINYSAEDISIDGRWLIDSVNFDLKPNGLMNLECHKIYPVPKA